MMRQVERKLKCYYLLFVFRDKIADRRATVPDVCDPLGENYLFLKSNLAAEHGCVNI